MRLALRSQAYGQPDSRAFHRVLEATTALSSAILTRAARSKKLMSLQVSGNWGQRSMAGFEATIEVPDSWSCFTL